MNPMTPRRFSHLGHHLSQIAGLGVAMLATGAVAATLVVSGQWEHVTDHGAAPSSKFVACMTEAEAVSLNSDSKSARSYFEHSQPRLQNAIRAFDLRGNTLSYVIVVGDRTIESRTVFQGDRSETVKITKGPNGTDTTTLHSRRLGPCS